MRNGMSSRAVLWGGFGSLLALMILVAVSANRALNRIEDIERADSPRIPASATIC
jgi:hypothetical protein